MKRKMKMKTCICVASKAPANTQGNGNSIEILQMPFVASCKSLQVPKTMLDLNAGERAAAVNEGREVQQHL